LMMDAVAADDDLVAVADNVEKKKKERQKAEEEEKALMDMVVKTTDENKYDDDHISTISATSSVANKSKKSMRSLNSTRSSGTPFLLKGSMKRAKKLMKKRSKLSKDKSTKAANNVNEEVDSVTISVRSTANSESHEITFEKPLPQEEALRSVIGLYSDDVDPVDPGEVERRLLERRRILEAEAEDALRQREEEEAETILASNAQQYYQLQQTHRNLEGGGECDSQKDIKFLNGLMKKNDRIKIREDRMVELDRKREDFDQKRSLQYFESERVENTDGICMTDTTAATGSDTILGNEDTGFEILSMPVKGGGLTEL